MIKTDRRPTRQIRLGSVLIGGGAPVSIQSMTNIRTADVQAVSEQIKQLQTAGCEIVRVAVLDEADAEAIKSLRKGCKLPLVADIHFDYKLALSAIQNGADGLRINPGNIGSRDKVKEVVAAAKEKMLPIRIGVNSGSLPKPILKKYGLTAEALVEAALSHVAILEKLNYREMKISVKASSVPLMIQSYRLLSQKVDYPLHLGVTEAGSEYNGLVKSAAAIGTLLSEGIGDTIRVSLTADPVREVIAAKAILRALELRPGLNIISCPTCGRTQINLIDLVKETEGALQPWQNYDFTVAVMGCAVNGPGEASHADFGIAGGKGEGLLFAQGKIVRKVPEKDLVSELVNLIKERYPL
ncbi:MAG TPA: flavodoxin-dependent (E)-4-hydroxy-3-methylbut-2-enyl-diphosphate synthase [Candidatus Cloacimonadota bacterium]|nr:flavodoxin-dependent (E)-4-hydroxy-3-methylbut-2-enyl-diphosphate synthase [Candidatus Cloacimonadota bacterium]HQL14800.1 flavodoxin-dependent (E)-4-hydroxy-3-methylbut-2-enyl-diphosphate synthase [Candidatus Cloacimonadota bacterium]